MSDDRHPFDDDFLRRVEALLHDSTPDAEPGSEPVASAPRVGRVYFIQVDFPDENGPIKIGFTAGEPSERLASLQTGNPWPLRLLGAIDGSADLERELHERFSNCRMQGEWFAASLELVEHVWGLFPHLRPPTSRPLLTPSDVAERLGMKRASAAELIRREMPAIRIGRLIRVHPDDFERWCASKGVGA